MPDHVMSLSILVVDDHPLFRTGIMNTLGSTKFNVVCDEACNGQMALRMMQKKHYDMVLLDIEMPVMDGMETLMAMKQQFPQVKVMIITVFHSRSKIIYFLERGVNGYILKSTDKRELELALELISDGGFYYNHEVYKTWTEYLRNRHSEALEPMANADLTMREAEIVRLICEQYSTKQIAERLNVSEVTVSNHRSHIMKKLETDNMVGIALYAVKRGLFAP